MQIVDVPKNQLPAGTTHGFRIETGNPLTTMFFHWNDVGYIEVPGFVTVGEGKFEEADPVRHPRVTYDDVLAAIPDRLIAFGLKEMTDEIIEQVKEKYGKE